MRNMSELKQHLHAVQQTRQITNAMYLLSTSRMKKAMKDIRYNLLYMRRLRATMKDIISKTKSSAIHNKYIEQQPEGRPLVLVITSDKGLCGAYNSSVMELALEKIKGCENPVVCALGIVGEEALRRRGIEPEHTWYGASQHPSIYLARRIGEELVELYDNGEINEVSIVYTEYVSPALQQAVCRHILPLLRRDFTDVEYEYAYTAEPIYVPCAEEVFQQTVPQYVVGYMYDVLMQASSSENCARMNAMQNATKNADEMIAGLSAEINAARQLAITNEITEIAAASEVSGAV